MNLWCKTRLQHSFSSFSKFVERKLTSRQFRTMLFFELPDHNTFHALKSIFFSTKFNKRHRISISFWSLSACLLYFFFTFVFFVSSLVIIPLRVSLEGLTLSWKADSTVQVRKENVSSTYNHLQVCGHWYSAVGFSESLVGIKLVKTVSGWCTQMAEIF